MDNINKDFTCLRCGSVTDFKQRLVFPEIDDDTIKELTGRIKPLIKVEGKLFYVEGAEKNPRDFSWPWMSKDSKVEQIGLKVLGHIPTFHSYGYYGMFKPSVAEVLSQIPSFYLEDCVAFSTEGPEHAEQLNLHGFTTDLGYHVAVTTLYTNRG